jgi:hypothetical protein
MAVLPLENALPNYSCKHSVHEHAVIKSIALKPAARGILVAKGTYRDYRRCTVSSN